MKQNKEVFDRMKQLISHANRGFHIFTANAGYQSIVVDWFELESVAIYDYALSQDVYDATQLIEWVKQHSQKTIIVLNMQIALSDDTAISNFNLSRDRLAACQKLWFFGMDKDTDERLYRQAMDFYAFVDFPLVIQSDEETVELTGDLLKKDIFAHNHFYDSYENAQNQLNRYQKLEQKYMSISLEHPVEELLIADMALDNIAALYQQYSHYDKALALYTKILQIREQVLVADDPQLAEIYNAVSIMHLRKGAYSLALDYQSKYKQALLKLPNPKPTDLLIQKNNVAGIYEEMQAYEQALVLYEQVLEEWRVLGVENTVDFSSLLNSLGRVNEHLGRLDEATQYYETSLDLRLGVFGENHL